MNDPLWKLCDKAAQLTFSGEDSEPVKIEEFLLSCLDGA